MKSKAIFAGSPENISRVYPEDVVTGIKENCELLPQCCTDEILKNGGDFTEYGDVEYIFSTWGMLTPGENEIRRIFPSLKAVFYAAGTVQYFAKPFLNCGVRVFSAWAANAVPVAEYTVSQIILANKGFFKSAPVASSGQYEKSQALFSGYCGNYGAKIGIIGAGMIGKLVIKMLKCYDVKVAVFDPFLPDETAEALGVEKVSLEEIFSDCDVISNHLANNSETVGMLCGRLFETMKPYSTFINTGRGAQVVEAELISVLEHRPDITALLDVTAPEPPETDSGFYKLDNCILTPHIAGSSGKEVERMAVYMLEEFENLLNGNAARYEVTAEMLNTMA